MRTVVTGIGPISSLGVGKNDFWEGLCGKNINIEKVGCSLDGEEWVSFLKHRVSSFNINEFNIDPMMLKSISQWKDSEEDYDLCYLLAATKLALEDSCIEYDRNKNNIGLIITHENPGLEQYFTKFLDIAFDFKKKNTDKSSKKHFYNYMVKKMMKSSFELQTFMPLFHVGRVFGFHGYSLFINNACASGAYAFNEAQQAISSGLSDVVVIVAADFPDVYKYLWFDQLNMYSSSGVSKPFSKNADGFILGDGATAVVLESLEHAKKRKAKIYAEYLAGGFSSEGWKVTLPDLDGRFYCKAIQGALEKARIKSEDLDLIIPHGVCTSLSDRYEALVFKELFNGSGKNVGFTALKPYFGHNLGGNVLLETAALMMMFEQDRVLSTLNVDDDLITDLNLITETQNRKLSYVLKTTCAFAGFDSALIFKGLR